jgi:hypothetical protein
MTSKLTALRSNELFGGVATSRRNEPLIQLSFFDSSCMADIHQRQLSQRAATTFAIPTIRAPFKLMEIQFSTAASIKRRCGGYSFDFAALRDFVSTLAAERSN